MGPRPEISPRRGKQLLPGRYANLLFDMVLDLFRYIEGVVEMMLDATGNFDKALTEDRLFGWHAALFPTGRSGMNKIAVGEWRNDKSGPMHVVSGQIGHEHVHYEAPKAGLLPGEMKAFLGWFNGGEEADLVLKASPQGRHCAFVVRHHPPLRGR